MLQHISTGAFIRTIALLAALYYSVVVVWYYRTDIRKRLKKTMSKEPEGSGAE